MTKVIRWVAGNLQIGNYIIPWGQCRVSLDAAYLFDGDDTDTEHCVIFSFNHPIFVPEFPPDSDDWQEWEWVLDGELAEAVRQFLAA